MRKERTISPHDSLVQSILRSLVNEGPMNAYQLEKRSGFAHSTFWGTFQPLLSLGYLELVSKETFRTGLEKKSYRISPGGFFELVRTLRADDSIWIGFPDIILQKPYLCPWMVGQIKILRSINATELLKWYIHTCASTMRGGMTEVGVPTPARQPASEESACWQALTGLFLEILCPDIDIGAFGIWHSHFPHRLFIEDPSPKKLRELQEEVMGYLSVRKDLTEYIRDGLKLAQTQLDQVESDIKRVQARFPA